MSANNGKLTFKGRLRAQTSDIRHRIRYGNAVLLYVFILHLGLYQNRGHFFNHISQLKRWILEKIL